MNSYGKWARISAVALFAAGGLGTATLADWKDDLEPMTLKLADFSGDQTANFGKAID